MPVPLLYFGIFVSPVKSTKPVSFFFAFPDGVFHYVCAECDALCCRGSGFCGNVNREMGFLLKQYPELSTVASHRQRDLIDVATPRGRCFFLQSDNLCQIEVYHGKEKKPGVCVIFPFNRFRRIGHTVTVTPHFMCPLRVRVPARPGAVTGTHSAIQSSLIESQMLEPNYVQLFVPQVRLQEETDPNLIIERETRFRDVCGKALGKRRFWDVLNEDSNDSALSDYTTRVAGLMAWGSPSTSRKRDTIDDVMLALASAIRVDIAGFPLVQIFRVLALSELLVRRAFASVPVAPTPQAIFSIIDQSLDVLKVLSYGDKTLKLRRQKTRPPFGHPDLVFGAFITLRDAGSVGVLKALEKGFKHLTQSSDRTTLVYFVAKEVASW